MKKIKFLLGALSFMAAAFTIAPAQNPVKTYLFEDFSTPNECWNKNLWNVNACTNISQEEGPLIFVSSSGNVFGGWIYDPTGLVISGGGFSDTLGGTYEIIARPIQLESGKQNIISISYMWSTYTYTPVKTFGVRVREENGSSWDTVNDLTLTSDMDDTFVAVLDSKWDGKTVEMEIFFSTQHSTSNAYCLLMDEIIFAAYEKDLKIDSKFSINPAISEKDVKLKLSITNTGTLPINSIEYAYTVEGSDIAGTIPVSLDEALEPLVGTASGSAQINIDGITTGNHLLKIRPVKINGEESTGTEKTLSFYFVDEKQLTQQYMPLFEGFTSSTCPPCATANRYFNVALEDLQDAGAINVIKYQMNFPGNGDPYYIAGNQTRMRFYDGVFGWNGYWSVPTPIYCGQENIWREWLPQCDYWDDVTNMLTARATADHAKKATMAINITKAELNAAADNISLNFEVIPSLDVVGKVFAIVVEKTTTGNRGTNGERTFHNVAMKFATNVSGEETLFEAGRKETFEYSVNLKNTNMEETSDFEIICFVQHETGYIFQSASTRKPTVANENEVMGDVRVYPNPASEFVNITNLEGADVEIFDLTGRRVYANSKVEGNLEIALASFANGTYVVRLSKDGQSAHRKLIVVR